ncbi:hypothetical protein FO519_003537 [Halicephalobus sp. NKZ332]|nr:hypothetical protein FO519_003537 [Halicephalobus sp. NKZ332]
MKTTQIVRVFLTIQRCGRGFKPMRGTGDKGSSSLFNNERRWKDDHAFDALGTTDELSSWLGYCRETSAEHGLSEVAEILQNVQGSLQDLGAHVATPPSSSERKIERTKFDANHYNYVHELIDEYGDKVPPLKQFILPGGGRIGAQLQFGRAVCRRAERSLIPLLRDDVIDENALKFLNRLSDLLFVLGRYACFKTNSEELLYMTPMKGKKGGFRVAKDPEKKE